MLVISKLHCVQNYNNAVTADDVVEKHFQGCNYSIVQCTPFTRLSIDSSKAQQIRLKPFLDYLFAATLRLEINWDGRLSSKKKKKKHYITFLIKWLVGVRSYTEP